MRRKSIYILLCISLLMLVGGCRQVPEDIKEKAKKYQDAEDVEENDIKYVSLSHILDHQKEVLGKSYQNLEFRETVHLEQPDSVSVLSLKVKEKCATKEKLAEMCSLFFGTDQYRSEIVRLDNLPERPYGEGIFALNYEDEYLQKDFGDLSDIGELVLGTGQCERSRSNCQGIYHADWGKNLEDAYELGGDTVSIQDAVDYVNDWCNTNAVQFESEYSYRVKTVYVYPAEYGSGYYYRFDVCKYYKGVPYDDIDFYIDENDDYMHLDNLVEITMQQKDQLSYFLNGDAGFDIVKEENHDDKLIGLEQAILLAQKKMTGGQVLEIIDIDIKYELRSNYSDREIMEEGKKILFFGSEATARPVWAFLIDYPLDEEKTGSPSWSRKFINVDMITGEVRYYDKGATAER